jgi:cellobiose-specific phosphotransferase system component IIA/RNA polymerase subunit RPABC4/transcription elongation factor Spt4
LPSSSGDKVCPICDSPLQPGSRKCGFCGTDLSIFDMEVGEPKPAQTPTPPPPPRPSVESRIEEIFSKPLVPEKPSSARQQDSVVREARPSVAPEPEPVQEPEPEPEPAPQIEIAAEAPAEEKQPEPTVEYFECPQCGANVETTANSCPKCGVLFAEEGADTFACPNCNTMISVDAKSCPGCGALFVEPGEEVPTEPEPAPAPAMPVKEVEVVKEPPKAPAKPAPAPKEEEKKGFFGMFKKAKKEEQPVEKHKPEAPSKPAPVEKVAPTPPPKMPEPKPVEIRTVREEAPSRPAAAPSPGGKDKGKELARMVAEMKPLLALAREKEVEIGESKDLIDEAALAGRERDLDKAIALVQKSKSVLMSKIDMQLADEIAKLSDEVKVAHDFGGDTARAATYVQEITRTRSSGDAEAAFVYVEKVRNELLPITGRYNESKKKFANMKELIANAEIFIVDTKDARSLMVDASKALEMKDFDKLDVLIRNAQDRLYKAIPARMSEEMRTAKDQLLEAKMRNVNITPMITILKSATNLMKAGDYGQALKEMREFREMMKKS